MDVVVDMTGMLCILRSRSKATLHMYKRIYVGAYIFFDHAAAHSKGLVFAFMHREYDNIEGPTCPEDSELASVQLDVE